MATHVGLACRMAVASQDTHSTAELRFALLTVAKTWDPTVMAAAVALKCLDPVPSRNHRNHGYCWGLDKIFGTIQGLCV